MRLISVFLMAGLLAACAADPAKIQDVAQQEADRLAPPTMSLSSFETFELAPMTFSATRSTPNPARWQRLRSLSETCKPS